MDIANGHGIFVSSNSRSKGEKGYEYYPTLRVLFYTIYTKCPDSITNCIRTATQPSSYGVYYTPQYPSQPYMGDVNTSVIKLRVSIDTRKNHMHTHVHLRSSSGS